MRQLNFKSGRGIYPVIDPSMEENMLLHKLQAIVKEDIIAVQLWDNFSTARDIRSLIDKITGICHANNIPVLINNRWQYLHDTKLDGVHFDAIPIDYENIKTTLSRPFLAGITCNNDLAYVHWANHHQLDYLSFCSMFPSTTSNSCELVSFDVVKETRKITSLPIFLAGGISAANINKLQELSYNGIAVVSGIMSADSPVDSIKAYQKELNLSKQ